MSGMHPYAGSALQDAMHSYSAELQALVCCARLKTDTVWANRLRELIDEGLDWDAFSRVGERHRLTPLAHRYLSRVAPAVLRRADAAAVASRARHLAGRSLRLSTELLRILAALEANGISALPLKGPLLALGAFGSVGWRE